MNNHTVIIKNRQKLKINRKMWRLQWKQMFTETLIVPKYSVQIVSVFYLKHYRIIKRRRSALIDLVSILKAPLFSLFMYVLKEDDSIKRSCYLKTFLLLKCSCCWRSPPTNLIPYLIYQTVTTSYGTIFSLYGPDLRRSYDLNVRRNSRLTNDLEGCINIEEE